MSESLQSVEQYIEWTKQLQGRFLLYRGLADTAWDVEASAYRRIRLSQNLSQLPTDRSQNHIRRLFQSYIRQLLDSSSLQGFRYRQDRELSDLELLAELQHYGAATCLIDFSANALTALWFACEKEPGKPGKVVALATDAPERFSIVNYERLKKPINEFLYDKDSRLWKWQPSGINQRVVAQQSVFVFGKGKIEKGEYNEEYNEIEIHAHSKQEIMDTLEQSFGITAQRVFNDFAGFAQWNAPSKPFLGSSAKDFFSLGSLSQQQGDFAKAIHYFDKVIELKGGFEVGLDPTDPASDHEKKVSVSLLCWAFHHRGVAKKHLGNYTEAVADYDESLKLNPQYSRAYHNRGVAKSALKDHRGAIADFDRAIEFNSKYGLTFCHRADAKSALDDFQSAIVDYDRAIELNPNLAEAYCNRGNTKRQLGDATGAEEDLAKAFQLDPSVWPTGSYPESQNSPL